MKHLKEHTKESTKATIYFLFLDIFTLLRRGSIAGYKRIEENKNSHTISFFFFFLTYVFVVQFGNLKPAQKIKKSPNDGFNRMKLAVHAIAESIKQWNPSF